MRFSILGPLEVERDGDAVPLGGLNQRATLGFLLLHANEVVATSHLLKALWGDNVPVSGRKMLHNAVSVLRGLLTPDEDYPGSTQLLTHAPGYLLRVQPEAVDLVRCKDLMAKGRAELAAGAWEPAAAVLRNALGMWRGPVLSDLVEAGVAWPELGALRHFRMDLLEDYFEANLNLGRHYEVLGELEALVDTEPPRERLCAQLMLALYRCGRPSDALDVYRSARAAMVDKLGLEPGRDLRELEHAILNHHPTLTVPEPRSSAGEVRPPSVLDGVVAERKRVSVLLVSAPLDGDAGQDPEDVDEWFGQVAATVREEVERFGGIVTGVVGSVVLAVFGVPRTREGDAVHAVRAAGVISDRIAVRVAVATGEGLVRYRASEPEVEPTVIGAMLDIGLDLLARGTRGEARICDVTRDAVEHAREQLDAPFLNREHELEVLRGVVEQVRVRRKPHLVTVIGESGIGKTRLLVELARITEHCAYPVRVLIGSTPSAGQVAPTAALSEMLKEYTGIVDGDSDSAADEKLAHAVWHLVGAGRTGDWLRTHLRPFTGIGREGGDEGYAAWRQFLREVATEQQLVLVIEDLHWADDALLDFVDDIADSAGSVPLLVIVSARPELLERRPRWGGGKRYATTISLDPLSDTATNGLIATLAPALRCTEEFRRALLERVGGNPLFAIEYARTLVHGPPPGNLPALPEPVREVLAARLDVLPAEVKAVLHNASVLDERIVVGAVAAVSGLDRPTVEQALEYLERRDFVERAWHGSGSGDVEYTFRSVLVREVALSQLPRSTRAEKIARSAEWAFSSKPFAGRAGR